MRLRLVRPCIIKPYTFLASSGPLPDRASSSGAKWLTLSGYVLRRHEIDASTFQHSKNQVGHRDNQTQFQKPEPLAIQDAVGTAAATVSPAVGAGRGIEFAITALLALSVAWMLANALL